MSDDYDLRCFIYYGYFYGGALTRSVFQMTYKNVVYCIFVFLNKTFIFNIMYKLIRFYLI